MAHVGGCIGELLRERGWSMRRIGEQCEVSAQTVSRWHTGAREPSFTQGLAIVELHHQVVGKKTSLKPLPWLRAVEQETSDALSVRVDQLVEARMREYLAGLLLGAVAKTPPSASADPSLAAEIESDARDAALGGLDRASDRLLQKEPKKSRQKSG